MSMHTDIGILLEYALRPRTRPGADNTYARLVARYTDDVTFRNAFDDLIEGLQMRVLHVSDLGVVLTTRRESVFAYRLSAEAGSWSKDKAKVLRGLAHLGIAAYAFPHPDDLHDPTVRYIDVVACEDFIRRSCTELRERADAVAAGGGDDSIVDLALVAGTDAAWFEWIQLPAVDVNRAGRGRGRISSRCSCYWVLRALRDLIDHGMARQSGKETDGRFQLLERYRHQVGAAASTEGYRVLAMLNRADGNSPDARATEISFPLPGRPPEWSLEPPSAPRAEHLGDSL